MTERWNDLLNCERWKTIFESKIFGYWHSSRHSQLRYKLLKELWEFGDVKIVLHWVFLTDKALYEWEISFFVPTKWPEFKLLNCKWQIRRCVEDGKWCSEMVPDGNKNLTVWWTVLGGWQASLLFEWFISQQLTRRFMAVRGSDSNTVALIEAPEL